MPRRSLGNEQVSVSDALPTPRAAPRAEGEGGSALPIVLVPVEESDELESTVTFAAAIAKQLSAELHVLSVTSGDIGFRGAPARPAKLSTRLHRFVRTRIREGIDCRLVTLRGKAAAAIPAYAQLNSANLVVVGRNFGTSLLRRSTAVVSRLARFSPVPVVVVPATHSGGAPAGLSPQRIVTAVDFTVASAMALRAAVGLSRRHRARLTIVHAIDPLPQMVLSGGEAWRLVQRLPAKSKAVTARLRDEAAAMGAEDVDVVVATSDAYRAIVDTATERAADLIVMGVAARSWLDEKVIGSTLRAVLRRAKTPVLVIPVIAGAYPWIDQEVVRDLQRRPPATRRSSR